MSKIVFPTGLEFLETKPKTQLLNAAFTFYGLQEGKGKIDNPVILSWAKDLGINFYIHDETPWCFKGDMEILTEKGFVSFKHLIENKEDFPFIAQADSEGTISFVDEWFPVIKPYYGELYNIKRGNSINITCDPEHQFYGKWSGKKEYEKRAIKDITKYGLDIPGVKGTPYENFSISDTEIKMLAAFLSDGSLYNGEKTNKFKVRVSKLHKIAELDSYPFISKTKETMGDRKDGIIRKQAYNYLFCFPSSFSDIFTSYKLLNFSFIKSLSQRQAKLFIDTYKLFDGTQKKNETSFTIFTGNKEQADNLVLLASLAGYKNSLYATPMVSKNSKIPFLYNINISEGKLKSVKQNHITTEFYEGLLYCVTVPSGLIVIRDYSGNIYMTGNCGLFMAKMAQLAGKPIPHDPLWALNWSKWGQDSILPKYGDVLVFKRKLPQGGFAGHVALYLAESENLFYILGGNQSDKVSITSINKDRLFAARNSYKSIPDYCKPIILEDKNVNLNLSTNEA